MMRKFLAFAGSLLLSGALFSQVTIYFASGLTAVNPVIISPNGGNFSTEPQSVTLTEVLGGATINWNIGGTEFQCTSPCAVSLTMSSFLTTYATAPGYQASIVSSAQFNITVSPTGAPIFTPGAPLTSALPMSVSVMSPSSGASTWCTTDGTPATTSSPPYVGAFTFGSGGVASQTTLRCVSQAPTLSVSAETIGVYTYAPQCPAPVLAPLGNTFVTSVSVTATDSCPSPTMYWAYDVQPTTASTVYSGPILVTQNHNIEIMATASLYAQSNTTVQDYIIVPPAPAATPTLLPMSGTQVTSPTTIPVLINDASPSATIYYCTAVSPATCTATTASASCSPAPCGPTLSTVDVYNVQAIATAPGFSTSSPANASYTIVSGGGGPMPCPASSGTISASAKVTLPAGGTSTVASSGTSPLLIFFDATGTTDSSLTGNKTAFQDDSYTWAFGDSGPSGVGVWSYGSNPSKNSKNAATGAIAMHAYVVTVDTTFTPKLTVTNGTSTVVCTGPPITVYAPTDAAPNGFGGAATTCVSSSTTPVAGAGGCPALATVLKSANFAGALNATFMGSGKRVLFKCGDTFTSGGVQVNGTHFSIGAYAGCEGTTSGRPILQLTPTGSGITVGGGTNSIDGRIADLDFEGTTALTTANVGSNSAYAMFFSANGANNAYPSQQLILNVNSNNNDKTWSDYDGTQIGLVAVTMQTSGQNQGIYFSSSGNQCFPNQSLHSLYCGASSYNPANFYPVAYNGMIGSYLNAAASVGLSSGPENTRVSACRFCVFSNNTHMNATTGTATLKFHDERPGRGYLARPVLADHLWRLPTVSTAAHRARSSWSTARRTACSMSCNTEVAGAQHLRPRHHGESYRTLLTRR